MEVVPLLPSLDLPSARVPVRCKSARAAYHRRREPRQDTEEDDDGESLYEDWAEAIDTAKTVDEGMRKLWLTDKETFYMYGERIQKMLELRLSKQWSEEE